MVSRAYASKRSPRSTPDLPAPRLTSAFVASGLSRTSALERTMLTIYVPGRTRAYADANCACQLFVNFLAQKRDSARDPTDPHSVWPAALQVQVLDKRLPNSGRGRLPMKRAVDLRFVGARGFEPLTSSASNKGSASSKRLVTATRGAAIATCGVSRFCPGRTRGSASRQSVNLSSARRAECPASDIRRPERTVPHRASGLGGTSQEACDLRRPEQRVRATGCPSAVGAEAGPDRTVESSSPRFLIDLFLRVGQLGTAREVEVSPEG